MRDEGGEDVAKKSESLVSKVLYWTIGVPVGIICIILAIKIAANG